MINHHINRLHMLLYAENILKIIFLINYFAWMYLISCSILSIGQTNSSFVLFWFGFLIANVPFCFSVPTCDIVQKKNNQNILGDLQGFCPIAHRSEACEKL